jgi:glycosyltransferase involved in cell wall biosynthesis
MGITKIFEYMEYGLPVIATDLEVWKDIVPNKCGICVNPNNIEEIHDAIKFLVDNPVKAKEMGRVGQSLVKEKYNWNSQEKILFDVYKKYDK